MNQPVFLKEFTPPADHKEFARRHARLFRWLVLLDDRLADHFPFRGWGDFFILSLRYAPSLTSRGFSTDKKGRL